MVDRTFVLFALSAILYGLLLAVVARAILAKPNLRRWVGPLLLAYVLLSFGWTLGQLTLASRTARAALASPLPGPSWAQDLLAHLLMAALIPLSLLFLDLTLRFLQRRGLRWWGWALGLGWLAAVEILYERSLFWLPLPASIPRLWLAFDLLVVGWGGILTLAAVRILSDSKGFRSAGAAEWGLALASTVAGGLLFLTGYPGWGSLAHLLGCGSAAYVLIGRRQADVRRLAWGTLGYLTVTLLMTLIYTGVFVVTCYACQSAPGYSLWLVALALALILAAVVHPLLDRMHRAVEHLFSGRNRGSTRSRGPHAPTFAQTSSGRMLPESFLGEYTSLISTLMDLEELAIVALGLIREGLGVQNGALFLVEKGDPDRFGRPGVSLRWLAGTVPPIEAGLESARGVRPRSTRAGSAHDSGERRGTVPSLKLSAESPLLESWQRDRRPLTHSELDKPGFHRMPPQERQWLSALGMDLLVPIWADEEWIGLLALTPADASPNSSGIRPRNTSVRPRNTWVRRSDSSLDGDDLELLQRLAESTGLALQNARLMSELRARCAESERRNRELAAANEELVCLGQDMTELLRDVSLDVRRPLAAIEGYMDVLRELIRAGSLTPERGEEMMQGLGAGLQRLAEMAQTLSEASRVGVGEPKLTVRPTSLADVVATAASEWQDALRQRRLTWSTLGLADLPPVLADGERLREAMVELIQNAIKFTPDGGQIQVRGHLCPADQPGEEPRVELVVADTGLGIARSDLDRVFERFYRAGDLRLDHTGRTRFQAAGLGLGLGRVRDIVRAHEGRVWVTSPGHDPERCPGTEVHIALPLEGAVAAPGPNTPESARGVLGLRLRAYAGIRPKDTQASAFGVPPRSDQPPPGAPKVPDH